MKEGEGPRALMSLFFPFPASPHVLFSRFCPSTATLTNPPSSPFQEWAIFSLVMSFLTGEMKKTLLFATYRERSTGFSTWSSTTLRRSRGRKMGKRRWGDPQGPPHPGRVPTALPGCPLLQNSAPVTTAQSCQATRKTRFSQHNQAPTTGLESQTFLLVLLFLRLYVWEHKRPLNTHGNFCALIIGYLAL